MSIKSVTFNFMLAVSHLVGRRVQVSQMILTQRAERFLHAISDFGERRYLLSHGTVLPPQLVQRLDPAEGCARKSQNFHEKHPHSPRWRHECALRLVERMTTEDFFARLRRFLIKLLQDIDDGPALGAVQSEGIFLARHRDLLDVLAQLDARLTVDLHQLVHAPEGRLLLTRHEVSACRSAEMNVK
jgi:hypothetical protein